MSVAAPGVERPNIAVQPVPADVSVTPHPQPPIQPQAPLHQTVVVQSTLTGVALVPPLTAPMYSVPDIPATMPEATYDVPEADSSLWGSVKGFFGDLWDGLRGTFDGLREWFAENFGAIKELAANYYQALKDGNMLAWLGLFAIVGIGVLALIGVGIVVVALKFIVLATVVLGAIVGVALIGYNIYQMVANPHLTPYERGKLLGTSIAETIFLLPAGMIKAPRLVALLSKAGRLFKTSRLSGGFSNAGRLLRATSSKLAPLTIFNKTSHIRGGMHLFSKVRTPRDIQFIRQFKNIETAAAYVRYFGSFETAVQFANKVGDAEQALVLLRRAGSYEKVLRYSGKLPHINDLAYLIELPDDLLDALKAADIKPILEALKKWNFDGQGTNQGIKHIIGYARGQAGKLKQNRLEDLTDVLKEGPFSSHDPNVIAQITDLLIYHTKKLPPGFYKLVDSDTEMFFIPKPASKSNSGLFIIKYKNRFSTFYKVSYKYFQKKIN